MENEQALIDRLAALVANDKRARERGDSRAIAEYAELIAACLAKLEALGFDRLECLAACEESN